MDAPSDLSGCRREHASLHYHPRHRRTGAHRDRGPRSKCILSHFFAWLPDGKWVVTDGLALLSTESGETRSLTSPPTKSSPDFSPAVSPDGRTVAFSRSAGYGGSDIYLIDLTEDLKPKGEPRRLTSLKGFILGFRLDSEWEGDHLYLRSFRSDSESLEGTGFRCRGTAAATIYWWTGLLPGHFSERQPAGVRAGAVRHQHMASLAAGHGSGNRASSSVHCLYPH